MVSDTQLSLVEAALNRVLGADPDSAARLARLAGRTIRIDSWIVDEVSVYLTFSEDGISISRHFEGKVDASIRGGALGFARGAMNPGDRRVFTDGTLTIEGDTGVVQAFADVFRLFRSDWPSRVSPLIGDAATARIEALVDSLEDWRCVGWDSAMAWRSHGCGARYPRAARVRT